MKQPTYLLLVLLFLIALPISAQETHTVNGKSYSLTHEIKGTLSFYWTVENDNYLYFVEKDNSLVQLTNTKEGKKYQEEYKTTLATLTQDASLPTDKVKFTRSSLAQFVDKYNSSVDASYTSNTSPIALKVRLGAFAGVSNSVYSVNPDNDFQPTFGIDFELIDETNLKRHALVFRFKQTLETSSYKYNASQFSVNYRFKYVMAGKLDLFLNVKAAAFTFTSYEYTDVDDDGGIESFDTSGNDFRAPLALGLGADYAVGKSGYITFMYNDIVALGIDNNGEFPLDFSLGYKYQF